MKRKILLGLLLILSGATYSQNIYSLREFNEIFINYINEHQNDYVTVRTETGSLKADTTKLTAVIYRKLYAGNKYKVLVCTDRDVKDFALALATKNTKGEWDLVGEVADNNSNADSKKIGDVETLEVTPEKDEEYKIVIVGKMNSSRAGYYGALFSVYYDKTNTSKIAPVTYYLDKKSTCEYDAKAVEARNCNEPGFANDSIQVNEGQSVIKVNSTVYQIVSREESSDTNSKVYKLTNDRNEKGFVVINPNERYIQFVVLNTYQLWSYHINSFK